jgi:hypothetical protein
VLEFPVPLEPPEPLPDPEPEPEPDPPEPDPLPFEFPATLVPLLQPERMVATQRRSAHERLIQGEFSLIGILLLFFRM